VRFRFALTLIAAALAAGSSRAAEPAEAPMRPVTAPHYGDTLFHFYQDKYFSAVTSLMVSQHFTRLSPHDDDGEILRGGLLLSYGMHREAGQIFAKLIERNAPSSVRDRAWYFLAKIRWQRGLHAEAEQAIARIEGKLPAPLEEDRGLLHANLLMARSDFSGAATVLRAMSDGSKDPSQASRYARFNLGVALVKNGDVPAGSALLDEVGRQPAADEEQRSLRDRANVALGFAALQDARSDDARNALQRVRLQSLQANKALLGFGWAAANAKEHDKALVPWTELAGRSVSDGAVLEAKLALPYAYAELGAYGQSLEGYQVAVTQFDTEQGALNESIAAIRSGKLVEGLDARNPGQVGREMGWFWTLAELPEMPHAGHLTQVLAQHEFQEAFKNYRDLRFLGDNLAQWRDSLVAYRDMLAERRKAFEQRLPMTRSGEQGASADLAAAQSKRAALAAELDRVERNGDVIAFADERQDGLLQRLSDVQSALQAQGKDPEFARHADKVRLLSGALSWELSTQWPDRLWQAHKALRDADQGLQTAQAREAALAKAQREEPQRFAAFARRIDALEAQINALIPRVASLTREQQDAVQGIAVAELARAQERLAQYQTQARFALAQLHDRAALATNTKEAGDAARR
jgi:hypothetical protein